MRDFKRADDPSFFEQEKKGPDPLIKWSPRPEEVCGYSKSGICVVCLEREMGSYNEENPFKCDGARPESCDVNLKMRKGKL